MYLRVIFFCIFLTQTSASFFDEFRGAMSSVENSFEKLLSDVVTDVEETIGCTILAVKQVLALGGIYHESSNYDTRCRGLNNKQNTVKYVDPISSQPSLHSEPNEKPLSERVSDEMEKSVSKVHNTMFEIIDKNGAYKNIVSAKANIARESDRLSEISALLRRELINISEEVKRELSKTESNANQPEAEAIWYDIKTLHEIELNHRNSPEATKIHHILNEIVGLLHGDNIHNKIPSSYTEGAAENESNDAFLEIQSQFEKMEQNHNKETNKFDADTPKNGDEVDLVQPDDFSPSLEGDAKKIMEETSRTFRLADGSSQQYEHVSITTTEKPISTENYDDYSEEFQDNSSFIQLESPKDDPARKEAVEEAKNLIEKSKKHDAILNDYFKKTENVGTSVFDDPELLGFA